MITFSSQNHLLGDKDTSFIYGKKLNIKQLNKKINKLTTKYQAAGYLNFTLDTLSEQGDTLFVSIYKGQQYKNSHIALSDSDDFIFDEAGLDDYLSENKIYILDYPIITKKILDYCSNHGYPFAALSIDSIQSHNQEITAKLKIDKGPHFVYDSIIFQGDARLSINFLRTYLSFKRNHSYNDSKIAQIPRLMSELPYITEERPAELVFTEGKTLLYLYCNKRKINQFDGYLGLVPKSSTTKRIALAGEINLNLRNLFTIGENISLQWKSEDAHSQNLELSALFPYLLLTPFGIEGNFTLEKEDTSYLNLNYLLGLQYSFQGNNAIQTYFGYSSSNVLMQSNVSILEKDSIYADYRKTTYGISLNIRKLDYIYNPQKGYHLTLDFGLSHRKLYSSETTESSIVQKEVPLLQYKIIGEAIGYIPLHKSWVLIIGAGGGKLSGYNLLTNELFRLGGLNSLRGFDEKSIYASSYLFGKTELRFLFAKMSFLNIFFNGGWYEKKTTNSYIQDFPYGFGIGISFDTKAGIFYLSYALGKQFDNPLSFQNGKIHFGITVNF